MPRWDVKIKDAEKENIQAMLNDDKTVEQIAFKYGVSKNCIYWHCKKWGIIINPRKTGGKKRALILENDYSILPDDVLFDARKFPIF